MSTDTLVKALKACKLLDFLTPLVEFGFSSNSFQTTPPKVVSQISGLSLDEIEQIKECMGHSSQHTNTNDNTNTNTNTN